MPFVGREDQREEIERLFDATLAGRGAFALLVGEPGIGKTRLADTMADAAGARGFRVAWGRAWESGGAPAFYLWLQIFEALEIPFPDASTAADADAARFQILHDATRALRRAAAQSPLLLILDDLHVSDLSSLFLLHFVARELRTMRVTVLATCRDVDAGTSPAVEHELARVKREATTLHLPRLGRDDVRGMLAEVAGEAGREHEEAVWNATQGNPLFVEEIGRLLLAHHMAEGASVPIPQGVRGVIRQRLGLFDPDELGVLEVAAVIGVELDLEVLARAAGASRDLVERTLRAARRALVLVDAPGGRLRFGHALFRDVLYFDLPTERRAALHLRIAEALERADGAPAKTEIAHHAIAAGTLGLPRLTARVLAAARALTLGFAPDDAVRLLERAAPIVSNNGSEGELTEVEFELGRAKWRSGDAAGATSTCQRIVDRARAAGDGVLFARAVLEYGAEFTIGVTDAKLHALLEEAVRLLPPGNPGLAARLEARLAASSQPAPDPAAAADRAVRAVRAARALGDDATLLDVLHAAGAALGDAAYVPERVEMQIDAVRLATRLDDRPKLLRATLRLVMDLMEHGDVAGTDAYIDAYESAARATRQARHMWLVPVLRAMRATFEGRWSDAIALEEEARETLSTLGDPVLSAVLMHHRFHRLRAQGARAELLALEPELLAVASRWNASEAYIAFFKATVRASAGDLETAREALARCTLDSVPGRIRVAFSVIAETALLLGETERAEIFYERMLPWSKLFTVYGSSGFAVGPSYARLLGGFAALREQWDVAEQHLEDARARAEATFARPELRRVLLAQADLSERRDRRGDVRRAAELRERANAIEAELAKVRPSAPPEASQVVATPVPAIAPSSHGSVRPAGRSLRVEQEGDTWCVTFGESTCRVKDSRGMHYLAKLVERAGEEVHALDLVGTSTDVDLGDAGEHLDAAARAAYKARLDDLREEIADAERSGDRPRAARCKSEVEFLAAELSRAFGLGGRARRSGSAAERARVAVTRRLKETVRRIRELSPEVGTRLEKGVKTGTFCSYEP